MQIFLVLLLLSFGNAAPPQKGRYIIKLKGHVPQSKAINFFSNAVRGVKEGLPMKTSEFIKHRYHPSFFNGFVGEFSNTLLTDFEKAYGEDIEYIERDRHVWRFKQQPDPPSWGLTRVGERSMSEMDAYDYPDSAGRGVTVYVVDSGIVPHTDFEGRAQMEMSFVEGEEATDLNGHGTHCAGTIGSSTYGIAKKAQIRGVKVLNAEGSGLYSSVIAGIEYVASKAVAGKTILSMSLGGEVSQSINDAVNKAYESGVVVIVAAGNEGVDACESSPAGAEGVFAVGATNKYDKVASFSNTGQCVKMYAPGVDITSTWNDGRTNTISGTSMACPHVSGVAALYMSAKEYSSPAEVYSDLVRYATPVQGLDKKLLYNKMEDSLESPVVNPVINPQPDPTPDTHPDFPEDDPDLPSPFDTPNEPTDLDDPLQAHPELPPWIADPPQEPENPWRDSFFDPPPGTRSG